MFCDEDVDWEVWEPLTKSGVEEETCWQDDVEATWKESLAQSSDDNEVEFSMHDGGIAELECELLSISGVEEEESWHWYELLLQGSGDKEGEILSELIEGNDDGADDVKFVAAQVEAGVV